MKTFNRFNIFFVIFILFHSIGYSYIDPGSLSAIWQFIAAILIGIVTAFSFVRMKIKEFFYKIFKKENLDDSSSDNSKTKDDK